jgi:hypothetical protein
MSEFRLGLVRFYNSQVSSPNSQFLLPPSRLNGEILNEVEFFRRVVGGKGSLN